MIDNITKMLKLLIVYASKESKEPRKRFPKLD